MNVLGASTRWQDGYPVIEHEDLYLDCNFLSLFISPALSALFPHFSRPHAVMPTQFSLPAHAVVVMPPETLKAQKAVKGANDMNGALVKLRRQTQQKTMPPGITDDTTKHPSLPG
jgi:hypothetical protein